ncbi:hypothetical protein BKA82DRAFT_165675 [Pisolithus tinctorius]|uniref:Uncharacterized protein n=1 Tax=Pisolithus tinctorius Marx 270 TaxID=870435 RepID=A0A0C3NJD8_PISTI|nr:hypothetical protein BKA82DRAFT_165675 [Pisolithus tinctorius]KIN95493.1 hypothetical protein M404DRAFT_165675 [Pisolithus tinctorius Marx 270]
MSASNPLRSSSSGDINTSTTDHTDVSSSIISHDSPPSSASVLENLKNSTLAIYAATPNLASHAEFFFGGTTGDIAIVKGDSDNVTKLVLSGIFEIDCQGFFMAPEGGYNPRNGFSRKFSETKLTCNLLAVQQDAVYSTTQQDFPHIISNIRSLEKLVPLKKGETLLSSVRESRGMPCIRLSHALFTKKDDDDDPDSIAQNGEGLHFFHGLGTQLHASEDATAAWPMLDDIKDALGRAASTHYISPLPAFDIHGTPIQPVDYAWLLSGAIVQVHFALLHFFIKGDRKSIFTTSLRELRMLRTPQRGPVNPLKRMRERALKTNPGNKKSHLVCLPHTRAGSF